MSFNNFNNTSHLNQTVLNLRPDEKIGEFSFATSGERNSKEINTKNDLDIDITENKGIIQEIRRNDNKNLEFKDTIKKGKPIDKELKQDGRYENSDTNILKFSLANQLNINQECRKIFCNTCQAKISYSLTSIKEHVNGKNHKGNIARKKSKLETKTEKKLVKQTLVVDEEIPFCHLFTNVHVIEETIFGDIILNNRFCVSFLSLYLMEVIVNSNMSRCFLCKVDVPVDNIMMHVVSLEHEQIFKYLPVLWSKKMDRELMRKVGTDEFHCAYCNQIYSTLEAVYAHLRSSEHKIKKNSANMRCQRHLLSIMKRVVVFELMRNFLYF